MTLIFARDTVRKDAASSRGRHRAMRRRSRNRHGRRSEISHPGVVFRLIDGTIRNVHSMTVNSSFTTTGWPEAP
ncbi:hypothetical protein [Sorangium sp. So ce426]|uniref:hypothetical protein n=1 Tax=unclassified Sorangium TaxID=2621164 RepID=UPI003F5B6A68